ncbi:DUF4190 domain-containing protein [Catenulispora sp. MAP5-51]|uniref:DUF4190 domain-containing protein n=1 Tax=Catenulispora sp. MAP5-51 TaxID=3156298 RepID=UPI00351171A5
MAIAALVLGICGFFFVTPIVGLVLGLVALSSVRRTGQKGKGLAVSGMVLSSLWIALFATLITVAIIVTPDPAQRDANGNVVKAGAVPVFKLHPKDCFTLPAGALGSSNNDTRTLKVVPCSTPHDSEAFAYFDATESSFPGVDGLRTDGVSQCVKKLDGYLPDPASLPSGSRVQFIYPNKDAWGQGERRVTCFLQFPSATMTQSVQRDLSSYNADQVRFLNAVNPLAEAVSELNALPDSADLSTLQMSAGAISNAAQAEVTALTAQPWPSDVQPMVDALVAKQGQVAHLWARAAGDDDESTFEDDAHQANAAFDMKDMQAIRSALGFTTIAGGAGGGQAAA